MKIDLICRGICALRPRLPGVSDNIRVISIVDRFLEHSRIFYFGNGGDPQVYIGSADWMDRNLSRRVEVVFPIEQAELKQRLINEILATSLADNIKAPLLCRTAVIGGSSAGGPAGGAQPGAIFGGGGDGTATIAGANRTAARGCRPAAAAEEAKASADGMKPIQNVK